MLTIFKLFIILWFFRHSYKFHDKTKLVKNEQQFRPKKIAKETAWPYPSPKALTISATQINFALTQLKNVSDFQNKKVVYHFRCFRKEAFARRTSHTACPVKTAMLNRLLSLLNKSTFPTQLNTTKKSNEQCSLFTSVQCPANRIFLVIFYAYQNRYPIICVWSNTATHKEQVLATAKSTGPTPQTQQNFFQSQSKFWQSFHMQSGP